jgi:hypothetical protein
VLWTLTVGLSASPAASRDVPDRAMQKSAALAATHAIRGVVKSISISSLVIVGSGKKAGEMTFLIGPSTDREGELTVGATVSVRYRREGTTLMATAVSTHPENLRAARTPKVR